MEKLENIRLSGDGTAVVILDQSILPSEIKYLELTNPRDLCEAIGTLKVRGAPTIGIFAAYALYVLARQIDAEDFEGFRGEVTRFAAMLDATRPTAVNLTRQLRRMQNLVEYHVGTPIPRILDAMREEAQTIQREDIAMCKAISEHGMAFVRDGSGIMTHCNAGPLATSRYGTGLGPILLAHERGVPLRVFCCETRPLMQGARLTMLELMTAGVDCTLICDNMASAVMKDGLIDAVFVGCDRVARNGDTANKIGTSGLAVLAKHYGVPFYVFCPSSTIDPECETGAGVEIEQRPPEEITSLYFEKPSTPPGAKCHNPAFDVTDNSLITAIITERSICKPPYYESLGL